MDFRSLRYFLAVASYLNFSRAAESLFISQSSLSQQIMQLEERLGVKLFERHGKKISLTSEGVILQSEAKRILYDCERLETRLREASRENLTQYPLRIYIDPHIGRDIDLCYSLSLAINEVKKRFNIMRLFFHDYDTHQYMIFDDREIDLWLTISHSIPKTNNFEHIVLSEDRFVLSIAESHPKYREGTEARELLETVPMFLVQDNPSGAVNIIRMITDMGVLPRIQFSDSSSVTSMYIATGEGVGIIPESHLKYLAYPNIKGNPLGLESDKLFKIVSYRSGDDNPVLPLLVDKLREIYPAK
ncbi:MAG: LysR family transcriptional regulator [Oscillospiraceae bacterium]|jgi:DNA-binding transcriptional LysR family regulator